MDIKEKRKFKKRRQQDMVEFIDSYLWIDYIKPYLENKIERYSDIFKIKNEQELILNKAKCQTYKDLLNTIENWAKEE